MATTKNAFTNASAMNLVAEILKTITDEQIAELTDKPVEDFRAKVARMVEVAQPKEREHKETAATKANKAKAVECVKIILAAQKPVDWKYIAERVNGITSSQKAVEVMKHAVASGNVERTQIKGKVYYQQAGISDTEEEAAA